MAFRFPLDTSLFRRRIPYGTWSLLTALIGAYLVSLLVSLPYEAAVGLSLVPESPTPGSLLAALFLHAHGLHLVFNVLFLWLAARDIEEEIGAGALGALYLVGGAATNLAEIGAIRLFLPMEQTLPIVGASGAIAVLMGTFAGLYPHARLVWRLTASRPRRRGIAAAWVWGGWLAWQAVGVAQNLSGNREALGTWGHAAGFSLGLGVGLLLARCRRSDPEEAKGRELSPSCTPEPVSPERVEERPGQLWESANRLLAAGDAPSARVRALQALDLTLRHGEKERAEALYRWFCRHGLVEAVPEAQRLEWAALLEAAGETAGALELLHGIVQAEHETTAPDALLRLARLYADRLGDRERAGQAMSRLSARFPASDAARQLREQVGEKEARRPPGEG